MIVRLRSTTKVVMLKQEGIAGEVPARIWEGSTASGVKVHAYITRIAVGENEDQRTFARELQECVAPSEEIAAIPLSLIL
jgi:hypothetical protein